MTSFAPSSQKPFEIPKVEGCLEEAMTKVNTETSPKDEKLWCDLDEEQIIPENSLPIVFLGLMLALFLAAMDQTIVAIALPRIIAQLHGFSGYSWVGTAYLLVTATLSPLYGRLSDAVGRKPVLVGSIMMFLVGSALCGAAQNLPWLILCRGLQGVGGGGIFPLVQIVMADITTLEERGKWAGATGTTWSIAAVLGPVLGGILTDRLSWRWTFYINLPLGALSCTIIALFLNTNPPPKKSFKSHLSCFDFLGLSCIFCSVALLLLGFSFSETSWKSPATISCLCLGITSLGLTVFVELTTKRLPIIPPRLFMDRTPALLLLCSFLHAVVYYASAYYLPLYFQSLGASATLAGIKGLAYSLTTGLFTTLGGLILPSLSDYRYILWFCWGVQIIGYGLMTQLSETSSITKQELYPFVAAMGTGGLFVPPLIALQGAMPVADLASSTSTYVLNRILGATLGVSIGHTIFASRLSRQLVTIAKSGDFDLERMQKFVEMDVQKLGEIQPEWLRSRFLHAYVNGISTIWVVLLVLVGLGCISVLPLRGFSVAKKSASLDPKNRGTHNGTHHELTETAFIAAL